MNQEIREQEKECSEKYMSKASYYRSVICGIVFLVSLVAGIISWSMSSNAEASAVRTTVINNERRITIIEAHMYEQHKETMSILNEIKNKVK